MRFTTLLFLVTLLCPVAVRSQEPDPNVNSRYSIEVVELPPKFEPRLSDSLRDDLRKLAGQQYDQAAAEALAERIRKELPRYRVVQRIEKGAEPETVRVIIEIARPEKYHDVVLPRLVYHSRQHFTFGADVQWREGDHQFSGGILTDNDELLERYSGLRGGYERIALDDRLRIGFTAGTWRSQWEPALEAALARQPADGDVPGIYRKRQHFQPEAHFEVWPGVTVGGGVSLQRVQTQYPVVRYENAHAVIGSLEVEREWAEGRARHTVEAAYDVRSSTRSLGAGFVYTRHALQARYAFRQGDERVDLRFNSGYLNGRAPFYDRFVLGNSTTLRGYNKYDIAPLGGSRMAHTSFDYSHDWFRFVYDVGAVYDRGGVSKVRHSIAAGFTGDDDGERFSFLVAFPLKEGRVSPVFILGINF